eukprot:TRINITY_DN531_c1_g1_i1.p2 TRINITY_DN531_c1_g1~~TRINITY_DN531_c1_g1_i1.p2  ORF type:complete len:569 (-),score=117.55 TRINITY_DN531_c1_g1_i1:10153-11859(-)
MRIVRVLFRQLRADRRRRARRRRRIKSRSITPPLFALAVYAVIALTAAWRLRPTSTSSSTRSTPSLTNVPHSAQRQHAMRPPQFDHHHPNETLARSSHVQAAWLDDAIEQQQLGELNQQQQLPQPQLPVRALNEYAHWCVHSSDTGDALCVHAPFCMRHSSLVYLSDSVRCEAYSDRDGHVRTLSASRCIELQRDVEARAEIDSVEHKKRAWVQALEATNSVLWFEGDTLLLRMSARCVSVSHFAERVFMLHHLLQHAQRYSMPALSNVVIAAHEQVAKKLRYSKSWHHGLLAAIVYPNTVEYALSKVRHKVTQAAPDGTIRVLVSSGVWQIAKGKQVPCFRRAALVASMHEQLLLTEDKYPGVVHTNANRSASRFHDARQFRSRAFRWLGYEHAPSLTRSIIYLHRSGSRRLSASGSTALQSLLQQVAQESGFHYQLVDVRGMTFAQQVKAVARAGVLVGVHGAQLFNCVFMDARGALVEVFPHGFERRLFEHGSGIGVHYSAHQLVSGDEFADARLFKSTHECVRRSAKCREWYRSDERELHLTALDAAALRALVRAATAHVQRAL